MCRFQAPSANCLVCFFALNTKIGDLGMWLNICNVWEMFGRKNAANVYGLNAGFPSIYLVRLVHYDQLPHFQSGLNIRKHSKKLTVKGGCPFSFPGWKCRKLFFLGSPSCHPPPNTPSRAGFQVSEILGFRIPSENRWQLKRFEIFTLHSFPLGGFSTIQFDECIFGVGGWNWKLETHQAPETALPWGTRSLHWSYGACAQLGSFLPWRPWADALQGWDTVDFWAILGGFLVQDPKNHKYVVLYLNIYGNDEWLFFLYI